MVKAILKLDLLVTIGIIGISTALIAGTTFVTGQNTPANAGTYVSGDGEKGFFEDLVRHRAGDSNRAASGKDILEKLQEKCGEENCIRTWIHAQHGWSPNSEYGKKVNGGFGGGENGGGTGFYGKDPDPQPQDGGREKGGRSLKDLKTMIDEKKIRFCKPCRIYIYGCEISNIGGFASELSSITGCKVHVASGKCSTAHPDGKSGTSRDPWRAEGGWDTYENGQKTATNEKYIEPKTGWQ